MVVVVTLEFGRRLYVNNKLLFTSCFLRKIIHWRIVSCSSFSVKSTDKIYCMSSAQSWFSFFTSRMPIGVFLGM